MQFVKYNFSVCRLPLRNKIFHEKTRMHTISRKPRYSKIKHRFDMLVGNYVTLTPFLLAGGGGWNPPPSGFSRITQKREKIFSSNLVTFSLIIICTIKLENRPFYVAMAMAQIKGV